MPYTHPYNCNCSSCRPTCHDCLPYIPDCITPNPCIPCDVIVDFKCVIYNTGSSDVSGLDGLNLGNGSSLKLFAETVDEKLKQLNVIDFTLANLRENYVINTLKQFAEAVDTEVDSLQDQIDAITGLSNVPLIANDSSSINFTTSGTLNHTVTAVVKISAASNNLAAILSDGIFVAPQTLSIDFDAKTISISNGNTINLSSIIATPTGYLGNVSSDPSTAINGNYWYNTGTGLVRIKVNNVVKTIVTA